MAGARKNTPEHTFVKSSFSKNFACLHCSVYFRRRIVIDGTAYQNIYPETQKNDAAPQHCIENCWKMHGTM
jgi:hypothetical protein